jgi:nitrogen fixation NifU-like protein
MSDPLYTKALLRLAADAHGVGKLEVSSASGQAFNPACGDKVTVEILLNNGNIVEMAHITKACVLAQASSSILGQALRNVPGLELERLRERVSVMLDKGGLPPLSPFDPYGVFKGVLEYPSRHRCVLLPIESVLDALHASKPGRIGRGG